MVEASDVGESIKQIVDQIVEGYKPERVILSGLHARGLNPDGEPVRLIILKETDDPQEKRISDVLRCYRGPFPIHPSVYAEEEMHLRLAADDEEFNRVIREGVVVYEKDLRR